MNGVLSAISQAFEFMNSTEIAGLSLVTWIVVFIVICGIGFILRGNK